MRNWRLRTKVTAVIVVPTLTAVALGSLSAKLDLDRAAALHSTVDQVNVAKSLTNLIDELQEERTLAVAWSASSKDQSRTELDTQTELVDRAVREARTTAEELDTDDPTVKRRYSTGLQRLAVLGDIRDTARRTAYPEFGVFTGYNNVIDSLIRLGREVNATITDRALLDDASIWQSLSEAKENMAQQNAILQVGAIRHEFPADMLNSLRNAQANLDNALGNYQATASPKEIQLYSDTVSGAEVDVRQRIVTQAINSVDESATDTSDESSAAEGSADKTTPPIDIDKAKLTTSSAKTLQHLRQVETALLDQIRDGAEKLATAATRSALTDSAFLLGALVLAVLLAALITRSVLRPMRQLRHEALDVAHHRLPDTVRRILAEPDPTQAARHAVAPVAVTTREETGQVARAFDAVQEQAVLMAAEQALLRDNINAIFVNLSRRSQTLVERQLSLIDGLEQDEQDPDQLASLFELDHLATRMRRYSESLLVLSGAGLTRQFTRPVPAAEVVGAAVSEVEQYARIEVAPAPDVTIAGRVVSDLVHLIAELLDNATFFSEPDQKVSVRMALTRGRELGIQITDQGIGLKESEVAELNERLANPPDLDVAVTRRMGLYVVARLAKRHGIEVRLRENEDITGGLIARVRLPRELVQVHREPATPQLPPAPVEAEGAKATEHTKPDDTVRHDKASTNGTHPIEPTLFEKPNGAPASSHDHLDDLELSPQPMRMTADAPTDRLPIYEAVLSQWFTAENAAQRGTTDSPQTQQGSKATDGAGNGVEGKEGKAADAPGADDVPAAEEQPAARSWTSPADEGWRAAKALLESNYETSSAGLPKRVPKAHLVPGSARVRSPQRPSAPGQPPARPQHRPRSADAVRGRMSRFQEGVNRGRHAAIETQAESDQEPSQQDEEHE